MEKAQVVTKAKVTTKAKKITYVSAVKSAMQHTKVIADMVKMIQVSFPHMGEKKIRAKLNPTIKYIEEKKANKKEA